MATGFDALPEPLRAVAKPRVYQQHTHPVPPPPEPLVDCGVYVNGHRLPGKYDDYAAALNKAREIELTPHDMEPDAPQEAFVWVGLHEPDEAHMQEVADVFG